MNGPFGTLSVRDQGMGLAPDQQPHLFQPFARVAGREAPGGIGLGLWIARELVQAHGGSIRVGSALGEGSSFIVELPCGLALGNRVSKSDTTISPG